MDRFLYIGNKQGNTINMKYFITDVWLDPSWTSFEFVQEPNGAHRFTSSNGVIYLHDADTIMIMNPLPNPLST